MDELIKETSTWFADYSSEFRAAVLGAVFGTAGAGIISFATHSLTVRQARREREVARLAKQKAHANLLIMRTSQMTSDLVKVTMRYEEAAARTASGEDLWRALLPVPNLPKPVEFTDSEIGMLMSIDEHDLASDLLELQSAHTSMLSLESEYALQRAELADRMPRNRIIRGNHIQSMLTTEEQEALLPRTMTVQTLAETSQKQFVRMREHAEKTIELTIKRMNEKFGLKLKYELSTNFQHSE